MRIEDLQKSKIVNKGLNFTPHIEKALQERDGLSAICIAQNSIELLLRYMLFESKPKGGRTIEELQKIDNLQFHNLYQNCFDEKIIDETTFNIIDNFNGKRIDYIHKLLVSEELNWDDIEQEVKKLKDCSEKLFKMLFELIQKNYPQRIINLKVGEKVTAKINGDKLEIIKRESL